jgi:TonB family protein
MKCSAWPLGLLLALTQPAFAQPTEMLHVSRVVMESQCIACPAPVYPLGVRLSGIQGTVVFRVVILKTGSVGSMEFVSGPDRLRQTTLDAVNDWKYTPYLLGGKPVDVVTTVSVDFKLPSGADGNALPKRSVPVDSAQSTPAEVLYREQPIYPDEARKAHISGAVVVSGTVSETGGFEDTAIVSGPELLRSAALDAVKYWRFKPATKDGLAIASKASVSVSFIFWEHADAEHKK